MSYQIQVVLVQRCIIAVIVVEGMNIAVVLIVGLAIPVMLVKGRIDMTEDTIGLRCYKKSGKPFLSKLKINTIKGIIDHPIIHRPAYIFEEDDSYVSCEQCEVIRSDIGYDAFRQQGESQSDKFGY